MRWCFHNAIQLPLMCKKHVIVNFFWCFHGYICMIWMESSCKFCYVSGELSGAFIKDMFGIYYLLLSFTLCNFFWTASVHIYNQGQCIWMGGALSDKWPYKYPPEEKKNRKTKAYSSLHVVFLLVSVCLSTLTSVLLLPSTPCQVWDICDHQSYPTIF